MRLSILAFIKKHYSARGKLASGLPSDNEITGSKAICPMNLYIVYVNPGSITIMMKRQSHFQLGDCHLQLLRQGSFLPKQLRLYIQPQRAGQEHNLLQAQVPN
jgi:hypothetical protein